jgi:hypothetical protein
MGDIAETIAKTINTVPVIWRTRRTESRKVAGDHTITTYQPPTQLGFEVTAGPARPTGEFTLTAVGDQSTKVRFALALQPKGMMRLMSRMITKQMRAEVACLDNAKRILEQ